MHTPSKKGSAPDQDSVLAANRRFYDLIAGVYEQVDRRRQLRGEPRWLLAILAEISALWKASGERGLLEFLDAGAGSGFLSRYAQGIFANVTALDLSQAMLDRLGLPGVRKVRGECGALPFERDSFHAVGAFATLHHLFDPTIFFREAHRVLKPGGILYTDHDIEAAFATNFKLPLKLYRSVFDHGHSYLRACPQASSSDYALSEFHGERGLSGPELTAALRKSGFRILREQYHWEGMGPFALLGAGRLLRTRGMAPILRILAIKE